jgi:hypothetical protein
MTNTYNTLNPLGSTSAKDLSDNASNFDEGMNSLSPSFYDRFMRRRETWAGMEKLVHDFLEAMGFEATHLVYVDGSPLTVLRPTQLIDRAGLSYKVKQPASFPVVLSGTWSTDQLLLVDVSDVSLRIALSTLGTEIVAKSTMSVETIADLRAVASGSLAANVWVAKYTSTGSLIGSSYKLDPSDTTSADDGGSVIVANDGIRRFKLVFNDSISLAQFGHDGTGAVDARTILQSAISAAYKVGGATVNIAGVLSVSDVVLLYPNVRVKGTGIGRTYVNITGLSKTVFRTAKPAGYSAPLCIGASIEDFTLNGSAVGNGHVGLDLSDCDKFNSTRIEYANMAHGLYFNKYAAATAGAFPYGQVFEAQVTQCQFASCGNATTWQGAANRNTFTGNSYNSCTTAFAFDGANNFSETNDFYNESVEGCHSWAEWSSFAAQIYSQNWYGMTVENPTANPFLCTVKDPGRQNFYGCRMIPGDGTGVSFYQLFPGTYSAMFGSKGASDRYSLGCRIPEEIWSIRGIRHLYGYAVSGYSGTLGAGSFGTVAVTVIGAQPGDIVRVSADKDLLGCCLVAHISAINNVYVRIQNMTGGSVTLTSISITAVVEKTGAVGPII